MSDSQRFAAELVGQLVSNGVTKFYLAPGARSQALAIAASQIPSIDLTVRIDERSLAFTALGRSLASAEPVAVITTSGTAVANLHPAVMEAHHAGVPLILLTADRPSSLRGKAANQTTDQTKVFGSALRLELDLDCNADASVVAKSAVDAAIGSDQRPGSVQLNIQFSEPLAALEPNANEFVTANTLPKRVNHISALEVEVAPRAVVFAGAGAGPSAFEFANRAGLALFAEPSSGSRLSSNAFGFSALSGRVDEIDQVFVFGKPTLSRLAIAVCQKAEVWVEKSENYETFGIGRIMGVADQLIPIGSGSKDFSSSFRPAPREGKRSELVEMVWNQTAEDEILLFGASELIRVADSCVVGKSIRCFANRGLAGIDGTVSTAIGLAQSGRQVRAVLGDLTLLHDAGGLNLSGLDGLNCQLIVGNDHGGEIFTHLEMANLVSEQDFEKLFRTPQKVDFRALAQAYGWEYVLVSELSELKAALAKKGTSFIEVSL